MNRRRATSAAVGLIVFASLALAIGGLVLALGHRGQARGDNAARTGAAAVPLAATAAVSPTPPVLTPAQELCIPVSPDVYRHMDAMQRDGVLNTARDCIAAAEGRPPSAQTLANAARPVPAGTPGFVPITHRAGNGTIEEDGKNADSHGGHYHYVNAWGSDAPKDGLATSVRAGYVVDNLHPDAPKQGVVTINGPQDQFFPTPARHGSVKITDAVGETLKLQAEDGTLFYFDVAARQYVAGFPAVTATPAAAPARAATATAHP